MSRLPTMDNPSQSPQLETQAFYAYAVIVHIQEDTHTDDVIRVAAASSTVMSASDYLTN
jgi:hypothetical protein